MNSSYVGFKKENYLISVFISFSIIGKQLTIWCLFIFSIFRCYFYSEN